MSINFIYKNYLKKTINNFLINKGYSSNNIYYLIKNGNVKVNETIVKDKNFVVKFNSKVFVTLNDENNELICTNKPIDIVYEDDYLIVVNKHYDLEIEPSISNNNETLANYISYYFKIKNIKSKVHLVNRLDKLTSGLVIIAKNQYIHNLMKNVKIDKRYLALLEGKINKKSDTIKIKIDRKENSIKRIVSDNGKLSITKYKLVKYVDDNSLVDIKLITGRTHQIRVSFNYINHPLVGDVLYNNHKTDSKMFLKAYYLKFVHPMTKKTIIINNNEMEDLYESKKYHN